MYTRRAGIDRKSEGRQHLFNANAVQLTKPTHNYSQSSAIILKTEECITLPFDADLRLLNELKQRLDIVQSKAR